MPIDIFIFAKCVIQHLIISKNLEGSSLLLRVSLWLFCVRRFWRRLQSCQANLMKILARADLNVPSDILDGLLSCRQVAIYIQTLLYGWVLVGSFLSLGSFLKGSPKFLEGLIRDCKQCPGKSFSSLLFLLSLDKEGTKRRERSHKNSSIQECLDVYSNLATKK